MKWKEATAIVFSFLLGVILTLSIRNSRQTSPIPADRFHKDTAILTEMGEGGINAASPLKDQPKEKTFITKVIDGDTIETADGRRIRYIGIDTPETVDPRKQVECLGREAADKNRELVLGQEVFLEKDVSETDKFGRLLRYVYILTPAREELMVNEVLVAEGYAFAVTFPPDVKYQNQLLQVQRQAREEGRGLWGNCPVQGSVDSSDLPKGDVAGVESGQILPSDQVISGCVIKGNISRKGEKIYHLPGCGSYDKTVIDETSGERWFCTEEEAVNAGWRKAKNC